MALAARAICVSAMSTGSHKRAPLRLVTTESPTAPMSPEALWSGLAAGDEAACTEAWRTLAPYVYRVMRGMLGAHSELDDLVQDVFLRLYTNAHRIENPLALRAFVLGITTRVVRKHLTFRWARRWLLFRADDTLPDVPDPRGLSDSSAESSAALRRFYQLLDELNATARMAFVLRHVQGLELTEVAAALDLSLATVKRRLTHAEERLQRRAAGDPLLERYVRTSREEDGRG